MTVQEIINEYKYKIDYLDLEILIANSLEKTREFVLTYPEQTITKMQETKIKKNIARRIKKEPTAYIVGHKEFYGLDFVVNKHTLVPRPETEQIVELVTQNVEREIQNTIIIDVGTGSGNIIISIANELENKKNNRVIPDLIRNPEQSTNLDSPSGGIKTRRSLCSPAGGCGNDNVEYFATDISNEALKVAKKNAKILDVDKKIKFLNGNLLDPIIGNWKLVPRISLEQKIGNSRMIILANLPYLSKEIYQSAPIDVKKFEPKSALYSAEAGLFHYHKLLQQLAFIHDTSYKIHTTCYFEISPEQKAPITKLIKSILPSARIEFKKDLAGKWRICKIDLQNLIPYYSLSLDKERVGVRFEPDITQPLCPTGISPHLRRE